MSNVYHFLITDNVGFSFVASNLLVLFRNAQTRQLSHPLPVLRAREIDEWSRSKEYINLLRRATQMNAAQNT